ncbi:hypothetical protein DR085_01585, partial [Mycoplasma flocculare]|uniref:hypothetical protein n=1 Tax=Mesomycoplasma flocculare TaxID=2128 RepID=UPI001C68842B
HFLAIITRKTRKLNFKIKKSRNYRGKTIFLSGISRTDFGILLASWLETEVIWLILYEFYDFLFQFSAVFI